MVVVLALVLLLQRISRPHVAVPGRVPDGSVLLRSRTPSRSRDHAGIANRPTRCAAVLRQVRALAPQTSPPIEEVLLDPEENRELDIEGVDALGELRDKLERGSAELRLAHVHAPVCEALERASLARRIGEERKDLSDRPRRGGRVP